MKRLRARDWEEFEDMTGLLVTNLDFGALPFKAASRLIYLLEKRNGNDISLDDILDLEDEELVGRLEKYSEALVPPNPTSGEGSANPSPSSA